jgi:peptidoglycan-associated lipoprotein
MGKVVFTVGLSFLIGCSLETASKRQTATAPQKVETKQEASKAIPAKPSQTSSLEALQKGTLGKGADAGPLRDVAFDFDRYDIRPDIREILKGHAGWLKGNPQVGIKIEGHCDDRGSNEYNLALGAKRAESVKRYLIDLGISPNRLSTISYGEEIPMCKERNESCWAKNRRAHFVVRAAPTS